MSVTVLIDNPPLVTLAKLTDNTLTTVFTARQKTTIIHMAFTETNGGTQALTIVRNDGTTSHSFRTALAVTAKQRVTIDEIIPLATGNTIKAQSGDAAGYFDVMITYLNPAAPGTGRG